MSPLILLLALDLSGVIAEPNLEKRADKALDHAAELMGTLRDTYNSGDMAKVISLLDEITASVELCRKSLEDSGKNARRSPKYFKKAEMRTHDFERRLERFQTDMGATERKLAQKAVDHVRKVHEGLLYDMMGKK
jgi:hypothetical protein